METPKRLKVLLVVCNNKLHGTERYVIELAKNLPRSLMDIYVATPERGELSEILRQNDIPELVYHNGRMNIFSIKGTYNLYRIIRKHKFDVIHANAGIIPNILGKVCRARVNIEVKHGLFHQDKKPSDLSIRRKLHEWVKQFFVDYFIAISDNDKKRMVKYFSIKEEKIKVIYNGIDQNILLPYRKVLDLKEESAKDTIIFGNIGRLTYQKAQDVLIEAFSNLVKKNEKARLLIIGSGEDEAKIKEQIEKAQLTDKVSVEGYKKNIFEHMRNLDVLVLTSRSEGVPYVILEAMCMGIPIISTKVGGIDNVLENEKTALLVEKNDVKGIEEAMLKLIENPALRCELSSNAMKKVEAYSIERMATETMKLYYSK